MNKMQLLCPGLGDGDDVCTHGILYSVGWTGRRTKSEKCKKTKITAIAQP